MTRRLLLYLDSFVARAKETRFLNAIASNRIVATLTLFVVALFFAFPSYDVALVKNNTNEIWESIFLQGREPFSDHNALYRYGSHADKLAFRFVPAIILNQLHITTILSALVFQLFTLLGFYYLLLLAFEQFVSDKFKAFAFCLPICFVSAGHVIASDYKGVFDTFALDMMLIAVLIRHSPFVFIPLLLGYFTDERALIASPGIFLIALVETNGFESTGAIMRSLLKRSSVFLVVSWFLYFFLRFYLAKTCNLHTGTGGINLFVKQIEKTFYTIYVGLEGLLIPFAMTIGFLWKRKSFLFLLLLVLNFFVVVFVAQSVVDINRSMSYVLPILMLVLVTLNKYCSDKIVYRVAVAAMVLSVFYDDYYPLPAQLYRMKFITHSI